MIERDVSRLRRISLCLARWDRVLILGINYDVYGCNLRVFNKRVLDSIPAFKGDQRFFPILAKTGGAVVRQIPVSHHPRSAGCSKYGVWNRVGYGIFDLFMVAMFIRRQITVDFLKPNEVSPQSCGKKLATP